MRFLTNLFHQEQLRAFLLYHQSDILRIVHDLIQDMDYEKNQRETVVTVVSYLLLKYEAPSRVFLTSVVLPIYGEQTAGTRASTTLHHKKHLLFVLRFVVTVRMVLTIV